MAKAIQIIWSDEPGGNVEHVFRHDVTPEEAEWVLVHYFVDRERSRSSDHSIVSGYTSMGRFLVVVFELVPETLTVIPITAYEPGGGWHEGERIREHPAALYGG